MLTFEKRESSSRVQKWMNDPATLHKPLLFDPFCLENKKKKKSGGMVCHTKKDQLRKIVLRIDFVNQHYLTLNVTQNVERLINEPLEAKRPLPTR